MLSAIVCMDNFGGIGKDGDLLYKIPEDMKRFKELTMGHSVIMGRKTWNSIGNKPLKSRNNIILSTTLNYAVEPININEDNGYVTDVNVLKKMTKEEIKFIAEIPLKYFAVGGESIYKMFLPYCEKVYATIVNLGDRCISTADVFFPIEYLLNNFDEIESIDNTYGNLSYSFKTFVRKDNCKTVSHAYSDPVSGHNAVDNPSHYCGTKYQVINFIEDWGLGYCLGNVVKYICRAGKKYVGDKQKELQDLKKAKWYLERRLEEHKNGVELDSDDLNMNISIDDFAEDQKLNYIRKKIIKNVIDCICEEIDTKFYTALELLDTEINRMEDETA